MSDKIRYLNNELFKFNLNFTVNNFSETFLNFEKEIKNKNLFTFTQNGRNYKYSVKNSFSKDGINYSNDKWTDFEFEHIKDLNNGSYNIVSIYKYKDKEYILREGLISKELTKNTGLKDIEQAFLAFYENLKHLILYFLIKKEIGDVKLIPIPYLIGLCDNGGVYKSIMIMEKGKETLEKYFTKMIDDEQNKDLMADPTKKNLTYPNSMLEIKKYLLNIYHYLYLITTILKIHFKHNDFKCNNIVVSDDDKNTPLIIDFGYCEFIIDEKIRYDNNQRLLEESQVEKSISGENIDYLNTKNYYNIVHDIIQLIVSLYFINIVDHDESSKIGTVQYKNIDALGLFTFSDNKNTNILDADNLTKYVGFIFKKKLTSIKQPPRWPMIDEFHNLYKLFYDHIISDLVDYHTSNPYFKSTDEYEETILINPYKLAHNLGLKFDIFKIDYEQKYLKYKMKYMKLKNKI